jgi:hypothetical protein
MAESTVWWLGRPAGGGRAGHRHLLPADAGARAGAPAPRSACRAAGLTGQLVVRRWWAAAPWRCGTCAAAGTRPRWPPAAKPGCQPGRGRTVQIDQPGSRRHRHSQIPRRQLDGASTAPWKSPSSWSSSPSSSSSGRSRSCRSSTPGWSSAWASTTRTLTPGLNLLVPFVDRVAYKHSLKEIPLDVPSQVCITKDNTQLQVDGILYFQVTDPMRASYGSVELHHGHHAAGADHAALGDRQAGAGQDLRGARPSSTPQVVPRSTRRR